MEQATPDLSVVIPTHDRRALLLRVLEALAAQTLSPSRFEVIVALDSVSDGSEAAIRERPWPFALVTVTTAARNAAATRNRGAARARAPRIVFLDDDIRVLPGFLQAHLDAADDDPSRIVVGRSTPDVAGRGWFFDGLRGWWASRFAALSFPAHRFGYDDLMSGNVSIPRALFERLGGFNAALSVREDYELGFRALKAGATFAFASDAEGLHRDESDPARNLRRVRAEGVADVAVARLHPELFPALRVAGLAAPTRSSWVLRQITFRAPGLLRPILAAIGALLPVLERQGRRRAWDRLSYWAWGFSYHAGVAAAARTPAGLAALRPAAVPAPRWLDVDLCDGIERARAVVEAAQPDDCRIHAGAREVGAIGAWPGLEPLGRRHLDGWLRDNLWHWSPPVAVAERLAPIPEGEARPIPANGWAVAEVDLLDWSLRPISGPLSLPLVTLVRAGGENLGWVWLQGSDAGGRPLEAIRRSVLANRVVCEGLLRRAMAPEPPPDPADDPARLPPISVVVCTRDRADSLAECLAALRALDYPDYEVVVVDNASRGDATARLVASLPGVAYVREDRPGLDWARNRGLLAARHAIVAFTDDDTRADRLWLRGLAGGFENPGAAAVTGFVAPLRLETEAERYFELVYGGMGKGFRPRRWSLAEMGPRGILWASGCGVGANMAFRREAALQAGLFDPALDVGTATRGGGDVEMFHRLLATGLELRYAPDAMVWHRHRTDWDGLGRQLADNGSGFAAYLMAAWRNRTVPRHVILRFALQDWVWGWLVKRLLRPGPHRRALVWREVGGLLRAPGRVRRARHEAARLAAGGPPVPIGSPPGALSSAPARSPGAP